ncbi:hypothetical protein D9756_002521 [Leucocoprinus leucothites]|uniref:Endonuclease/exonuclease/phosphatase domain-containing protein n=1 Tax=Leucocoprinus leucothites TaxID=201217 RepID=A0A8H5GCK5_9AGAR|nr:hypothetical protein D9756_002521 [Leucoagaricus leucothites]
MTISLVLLPQPETHVSMSRKPSTITELRIFSQNVNHNYMHVDYLLDNLWSDTDILFFQELPWCFIRQTVSTSSPEGDEVVGAPKYPDWLYMVCPPALDSPPRIMAYVHKHLLKLRPALWQDLIDHCDVLVLSLFSGGEPLNLMNIYLDDMHTAINLLLKDVDTLPTFIYIGGNFNCHSSVWDPAVEHHCTSAISLLETVSDLGVEWARPINAANTYIPHNMDLEGSVIDLMFTQAPKYRSEPPQVGSITEGTIGPYSNGVIPSHCGL